MGKKILMLANIEIKNTKFYRHKAPVFLKNVDIEKVLVSNKVSFSEKSISTSLVTFIIIIKLSYYI